MVSSFFNSSKETPVTLRARAEKLLAMAEEFSLTRHSGSRTGEHVINKKGDGGEFRQFRNYQPGDRPQDIDWKRSAKTDDVFIREKEKSHIVSLSLFIQNHEGLEFKSAPSLPSKYESCAVLALAFALDARRRHDPVRYQNNAVSPDSFDDILLYRPRDFTFHSSSPHENLVLLGDFTDPYEMIEKNIFEAVRTKHVILLHCYDPAELSLPYQGRVTFHHPAHQSLTINDIDQIRQEYKTKLQAHREKIAAYALHRGWHYQSFVTDQPLIDAFTSALNYLQEKR